jgi:hypothetical protein
MRVDIKNFTYTKFKEEQIKNTTVSKDTIASKISKDINMQARLKRDL